jgi:hypothetical protein
MKEVYSETLGPDILNDSITFSILKAIAYFDIFSYPLKSEEIFNYSSSANFNAIDLEIKLQFLTDAGVLKTDGEFYYLGDVNCIDKRKNGNQTSEKYWGKALRYSRIISYFPFVRCICISGSLSKNYMDEQSDIDYFIITKPGRLWLCRMMLVLFKKILLFNSHKYFCINYLVDAKNLEIPDRNIFTATEIITLVPTYNHELFLRFMQANSWVRTFYPNAPLNLMLKPLPVKSHALKKIIEVLFNYKLGLWADRFCMRITLAHRKRKFSHLNKEEFNHRLRSAQGVSKHHPESFQQSVLDNFANKMAFFESRPGFEVA